jgi:hypothetical protein
MHASLAVTFTYDRHLNKVGSRRSIEECYHWSQSTALLNRRLREPMKEKDKDPIWATAAALTILIFSSPDPCKPEESWPLKPSDRSDLDWLHMSKGKMSLWHIVDPLRPDSLFRVMGGAFAQMKPPFPKRGKDGVPDDLAAVCFLSDASTPSDNPYFYAAHAVARLLSLPDSEVTTCRTQIFILNIHSPFEDLLRSRDPVALLLLYLWYRKASPSTWWIALRAKVECPSICLYLQLYHKGNAVVQAFLPRSDLAGKFN